LDITVPKNKNKKLKEEPSFHSSSGWDWRWKNRDTFERKAGSRNHPSSVRLLVKKALVCVKELQIWN
jgi:hypothetical protein